MRGRAFIAVANRLLPHSAEADWRAIVGRAYYGLLLEARDWLRRWGIVVPPRDSIHRFVRVRFDSAKDRDLRKVADYLQGLSHLRNKADYQIESSGPFTDFKIASEAIRDAGDGIDILDQIESNSVRRLAALAAIKAVYP